MSAGLILNMRIRKDAPCLVLRLAPYENLESWGKLDGDSFHGFPRYFLTDFFFFLFLHMLFMRALSTRDIRRPAEVPRKGKRKQNNESC